MTRSPPGCDSRARDSRATPGRRSPPTVRLRLKPCCAGRAERAVHRAADLAGDAQRAAAGLGDEDHLDALRRRPSPAATCACRRPRPASCVISGVATSATSFRRSRKIFARSVIWSKSATRRLYSHFISWRARNGFSPIRATNASSSARVRPSRFVLLQVRSESRSSAATILTSLSASAQRARGHRSAAAKK